MILESEIMRSIRRDTQFKSVAMGFWNKHLKTGTDHLMSLLLAFYTFNQLIRDIRAFDAQDAFLSTAVALSTV
jgi:hypothetical protein